MAPNKLTLEQKAFLLETIAEGLSSPEIRVACNKFGFEISPQTIRHYRYTKRDKITELQKTVEIDSLQVGLARRGKRIAALGRLYKKLERELYDEGGLWLDRTRSLKDEEGKNKLITEKDFNASLVRELRLTLDDIAKETGGRSGLVAGTDELKIKGYMLVSPDAWPSLEEEAPTKDAD